MQEYIFRNHRIQVSDAFVDKLNGEPQVTCDWAAFLDIELSDYSGTIFYHINPSFNATEKLILKRARMHRETNPDIICSVYNFSRATFTPLAAYFENFGVLWPIKRTPQTKSLSSSKKKTTILSRMFTLPKKNTTECQVVPGVR